MNSSTDETVISGAWEPQVSILLATPVNLLNLQPSIGIDTGLIPNSTNAYSTISSTTMPDASTPHTSFIEQHKKLLMWSGIIIVAAIVVKYV